MTATISSTVHDRLATLADPTRGRILLALDQHELTVGELCSVLSLPQSTVSRHLRVLSDDHWLSTRHEGTSRYYSRSASLEAGADRLWSAVAEDLRRGAAHGADQLRLREVIAQRRAKSREFFTGASASWDELRAELFGSASGDSALLGLLDETWTVGDLGCGGGHLAEVLSPYVGRVIGVDASPDMLRSARERVSPRANVDLRLGDLESLPIADAELDAAVLSLVLHHAPEPLRVLTEARRVLKASGRLLLVDLPTHDHVEYREGLGHVWLGFSEAQVTEWMRAAGLARVRYLRMRAEPSAKGPGLFVATGIAGAGRGTPGAGIRG